MERGKLLKVIEIQKEINKDLVDENENLKSVITRIVSIITDHKSEQDKVKVLYELLEREWIKEGELC